MADIGKSDGEPLSNLTHVAITNRMQSGDGAFCVVLIVEGNIGVCTGAFGLSIAPLCFLFLNVSTISEHDPA